MPQKHAAQYDETGLTRILVECRIDRNELLFKPIHHRQPHRLLCREVAQDGGLCNADRVRDRWPSENCTSRDPIRWSARCRLSAYTPSASSAARSARRSLAITATA